jgi:hypothetical protein
MSKELVRWMVANIEMEYIKELDNKYTGYNNNSPKSILAHLVTKYCKATVANKLKADGEFAKPWDQVTNIGTLITRLEVLHQKCDPYSPAWTMKHTMSYQTTISIQ